MRDILAGGVFVDGGPALAMPRIRAKPRRRVRRAACARRRPPATAALIQPGQLASPRLTGAFSSLAIH